MSNAEHLTILKRGIWAWNKWRFKNDRVVPDLSGADLHGMNLYDGELRYPDENDPDWLSERFAEVSPIRIDLSDAYLHGANLRFASLCDANFRRADLSEADLSSADLQEADLSAADLSGADLQDADLTGADLRGADLRGADLRRKNPNEEFEEGTRVIGTNFGAADLRGADLRGLDLSESHGLTREQIASAVTDADTKFPPG